MKNIKCILFDLDGTLIDTTPLILESFKNTFLYHFNEDIDDSRLLKYLGIPLKNAFQDLYPGMVDILIKTYREINEQKHDRYIGVFIGVVEALQKLHSCSITLGIVTSKRRELALRGLRLFDLDKYMSIIVGPEDTVNHKPQGEPIQKALEKLNISEKEEVLYVGDSPYDILCAKNAGVRSAAVNWSYLPYKELDRCSPDYRLFRPQDIFNLI